MSFRGCTPTPVEDSQPSMKVKWMAWHSVLVVLTTAFENQGDYNMKISMNFCRSINVQ